MAHILLIEDNDQTAEVTQNILTEGNHTSVRVETAYEATIALVQEKFDLILVDLLLGRSNGAVAALALRGMKFEGPMIVVTGGILSIDQRVYDLVGFVDRLQKPFTQEELINAVNFHLQLPAA